MKSGQKATLVRVEVHGEVLKSPALQLKEDNDDHHYYHKDIEIQFLLH